MASRRLDQEREGIGPMEPLAAEGLVCHEKVAIEADHLGIEIHAVKFCLGPAGLQVAAHVSAPQPQLEHAAGPLRQQGGDGLLMGQAEAVRGAEDHGGLHHTVDLQPAMQLVLLYADAASRTDSQVQ